ncbi:pyruvate, phosphate dikinase [Streptomyces atratus]|uniref:Pyruvate phosphate dikinase n=1 Tax=Streptomyces atratus TaxID=1893 RepID=A0A286MYQ3_STRAR|nr:pyruvate, phosphate dikinase [Streptomyces atratus]ASX95219.1 pyruvate phosphate dikinase [Streptomyces atratus]AXE76447.1 pyruvate, phosphate dikinase [Streptomyces atratus]
MTWIHPISAEVEETAEVLGGKALGLVVLRRLGLPVPPGFVISTEACRTFLRTGGLPSGLDAELAAAVDGLEAATHRRLGGPQRPLAVSVRSGGSVSMPGMMSTVLNLGLTTEATTTLADETGDLRFALDSRLRFLTSFASEVAGVGPESLAGIDRALAGQDTDTSRLAEAIQDVEQLIAERSGASVPEDATRQLELAVEAVFSSWNTPRAKTYRELHGIPHDLGTAVTVQAMVFGNRDQRSGTGVAFSRDPNTGEHVPFGEALFGRQGEDVVSGSSLTEPLSELADREPEVWTRLLSALTRLEENYRDACYVEFTFEAGELWILQVRRGRFVGRAAVRVAVDLADAGTIGRDEALLRVSPQHLTHVRTPRITAIEPRDLFTRGLGASPGVAVGRVATTADSAARLAAGGPVVLLRPETSPLDMHGLAAAAGVVTARGGPTSHAAVVARSMGKPAVVGAANLTVDAADGCVRAGGRTLPEGTLIALDGTGGEVVVGEPRIDASSTDPQLHRLLGWADDVTGDRTTGRNEAERLASAQAALRRTGDRAES